MGTLINDCDQCFFDSVASEFNALVGTDAVIYVFSEAESVIDPLWGEEITTVYEKDSNHNIGIQCPVFVKSPERTSNSREEGYTLGRRSTVEIAALDMRERNIRRLHAGDIIYFTEWGLYYDVVESSSSEGQISDSGLSSKYMFDIVRRTEAVPESVWRPGEDG